MNCSEQQTTARLSVSFTFAVIKLETLILQCHRVVFSLTITRMVGTQAVQEVIGTQEKNHID